ncbi:MAG: hypothetical protein WCV88_05935 [Patescibacteria group bacterium]|jgi:hypothetical protein
MKYFLPVCLALLLVTGCTTISPSGTTNSTNNTNTTTYWLNYYPTQCNKTPWGDTLTETAITEYYQTSLQVTVMAVEVNPPTTGFISCAACGCSTGAQVSIQTNEAGKVILLEHGFTEEELYQAPVIASNENTNTVVTPIETNDVPLSEVDAGLRDRSNQVVKSLKDYYTAHGSYPDNITELNLTVDLTGLTYTPIGSTPADYYDLNVEYSTGGVVMNP